MNNNFDPEPVVVRMLQRHYVGFGLLGLERLKDTASVYIKGYIKTVRFWTSCFGEEY